MSNYNRIVLMGRLVKDPEMKTTGSGVAVTNFSIAVNRTYSKNEEVDFFNVTAWRQLAEVVSAHKKKGDLILLEGRLQSRNYEANDGTKRTVVEVVADNIQFMPNGTGSGGGSKSTAADDDEGGDDIPFS